MRISEITHSRDSMLKKRVTFLNRVKNGELSHSNGLSYRTVELIELELDSIRAEQKRRKEKA